MSSRSDRSSQASADLISASSGPGCESSGSASQTSSASGFSPSTGRRSRATKTSVSSQQPTWSQLTLWSEDSPAKASPTPENASDCLTPARVFGRSTPASFASYSPDTSSWKTLQLSLLEEWAEFSETWPRSGMTQNGTAYRLAPLAPLTDEIESGSWPTPTASEYTGPGNAGQGGDNLRTAVWRTPQARDGNPRGASDPRRREAQGHSVSLHDQIGGQLNPTWVEWLMGFPIGFTDLEASGTLSSPRSPNGSDSES
jgi:hypothetical protein